MRTDHIVNQIHNHELRNNNILHVVGCVTNPVRYHSRYRLARKWLEEMAMTPNVRVYMVEAAYGDRRHEVTDPTNPHHLQVRINSEIWIKENLLNLGIRTLLPKDWRYVAWVDTDITFRDSNWAQEAMHQLQHFEVIQPWSDCMDLGHHGNVMNHFRSMGYLTQQGLKIQKWTGDPYPYGHSGFAWCATRRFYENVEKLMEFAILGSADHHMAWAMLGATKSTVHNKMTDGFKNRCTEWETRASRAAKKQIGFCMGRIEHHYHGSKEKRKYRERWQILIDHQYDPNVDIMYDEQGIISLIGKPDLEHDIMLYNRGRDEDAI